MQTDALDIADTSPQDWKYISEGGSTIVFSYVGPPNTLFDRTALRLRKGPVVAHSDPDKHQEPQLAEPSTQEDRQTSKNAPADPDEPDDPTIVFQRTVIEQLMPIEHLPRLQSVHVARAWLEELAERTEPLRPPQRRAKDTIDRGKRKAVLATDLVGGAGCAVEIKVRPSHLLFLPCLPPPRRRCLSYLVPTLALTHDPPPSRNGASSRSRHTSLRRHARSRRAPAASACTRT